MANHEPAKITLVGVIVICLLVVVAVVIVVKVFPFGRTRGPNLMSRCASNLNAVGKGIQLYMTENDDAFPLLHTEGDLMAPLGTATDSDDVEQLNTNAMQSVWLMIQSGFIRAEHFKCPSDKTWTARKDIETGGDLKKYGWNDWSNFSVGIHKPYGKEHASPLTEPLRGSFPIFADKNFQADGRPGSVYYNSKRNFRKPGNHPRDGINYLTYGSSVSKARYSEGVVQRFSACGVSGDDIYVAGDNGGTWPGSTRASANPTRDTDTFILPWQAGNR